MRRLFFAFLIALAATASAAECRRHNKSYVSSPDRGVPFLLKNQLTGYVLSFRYIAPSPTQPGRVHLAMPAPVNKTGFSRFDFTSITINGIDSRAIEPKSFEVFNKPDESGVDVHYNFNGIPMILRLSVSDASPLLTMTWMRGEGKPRQQIKSAELRFSVLPSAAGKRSDSYSRELVTPTGKYEATPNVRWKKQPLSKDDTWIIMQDTKYQYPVDTDYASPVLLCPVWDGIISGTARHGVHQDIFLNFQLDPNAQSWTFRMLDCERKRSNADFYAFLKEQKIVE